MNAAEVMKKKYRNALMNLRNAERAVWVMPELAFWRRRRLDQIDGTMRC